MFGLRTRIGALLAVPALALTSGVVLASPARADVPVGGVFRIVNGELTGAQGVYGTTMDDVNTGYGPLWSAGAATVTTTFSDNGNGLAWDSPLFSGGRASYCVEDNHLFAVYKTNAAPSSCVEVLVGLLVDNLGVGTIRVGNRFLEADGTTLTPLP
ncbi:hypothetical protein QMK19_12655 [Streptomyces sp. H10-C2]|uniref:hypothetical protein n=1 Tax=unclassified Streptomyces TaxID=2593676 RepID=UPI0024BA9FAB|nr:MULTISPECIES: hypothetical protein [unclassified Streptomyces]MDJ0345984.1 hypothetical protein [Streptomyces sp. PH10-H1]MDJ0370509.1 hypothetical protein [Streptomyces sp. H10-C2]